MTEVKRLEDLTIKELRQRRLALLPLLDLEGKANVPYGSFEWFCWRQVRQLTMQIYRKSIK